MKEELFTMSTREIEILSVIENIVKKRLSQIAAAKQLGVTTRHIRRLVSTYSKDGVKGLISKQRGKISNRRFRDDFKSEVQGLIRQYYTDFGPTLAVEKLKDLHNINISIETARQWMINDEIWKPKCVKVKVIHPRRPRRSHFGELIQIDGSPHAWFENRGPKCCLLVFIDDATSKIIWLYFCENETTFAYIDILRKCIEKYGKPQSIYSDKHAIFTINTQDAIKGIDLTQFGRVLKELDIEHIHANSPQAKGRVERCNETLQDRLVKELRLLNINTIEAANAFLDTFNYIDEHNLRFSVPPAKEENGHLPAPSTAILDKACCAQHTRIVSSSLNCQYNNHLFQIKAPGTSYNLRRAKVTICQNSAGNLKMFLTETNQPLEFQVYTKNSQLCKEEAMLPEKPLPARMDKKNTPSANHPWRQYKLKTN